MTFTHSCPNFHVIIDGPLSIEFKFCWKCGCKMLIARNNAIQKSSSEEISLRERTKSCEGIRRKNQQEADE